MPKSQVESAALVAAALAATLALTLLLGPFAWMGSIAALVLLLILFGFDQEGYRTLFGSLAFSAVCGFCFAVACGAVFKLLAGHGEVHLENENWATVYLPLTFAFATALLWGIDRSRMGARQSLADQLVSRPGPIQSSFIRETAAPFAAPPRPYVPEPPPPPPPPPVPTPVREPYNTYSQGPLASQQAVPQQPAPPQPMYAPPPPVFDPPTVITPPPSMLTPTTSEAVRPAPMSIVSRGGKEVMIYVNLIGEGLNVMRSVRAEHLGRDYYSIIDTMPEGETWQFQPGQVVRCKKQTLSTGKALVAFEEAPRA